MSRVSPEASALEQPGRNLGLLDVFHRRYLLSLIVRKEVQIRYRGSVLGWMWSYVKPLVQFVVFYVAIGVFLGMNARVEFFPIYLLAGITVVTFFNEAFSNGTRSLVDNAALIKKIYLPREMFPVSSMLIAAVNTIPQIIVVIVIALFFGWAPSLRADRRDPAGARDRLGARDRARPVLRRDQRHLPRRAELRRDHRDDGGVGVAGDVPVADGRRRRPRVAVRALPAEPADARRRALPLRHLVPPGPRGRRVAARSAGCSPASRWGSL